MRPTPPDASLPSALDSARRRLRGYLRQRRLRSTRQRDQVLEVFLSDPAHASVEEIYDRVRAVDSSVGFATVYRSMGLFVEAGLAKERRFYDHDRVRYEPALDGSHHDHLVCNRCGEIQEFEDPTIERLQEEVARSRGFRVTHHRLELYGLCGKCQEAVTLAPRSGDQELIRK